MDWTPTLLTLCLFVLLAGFARCRATNQEKSPKVYKPIQFRLMLEAQARISQCLVCHHTQATYGEVEGKFCDVTFRGLRTGTERPIVARRCDACGNVLLFAARVNEEKK